MTPLFVHAEVVLGLEPYSEGQPRFGVIPQYQRPQVLDHPVEGEEDAPIDFLGSDLSAQGLRGRRGRRPLVAVQERGYIAGDIGLSEPFEEWREIPILRRIWAW